MLSLYSGGTLPTIPLLWRALLAFLALPGIIGLALPLWIAWPWDGPYRWIGLVPLAAGLALMLRCAYEFCTAGQGTLAPWDPPRHLVTSGPYRWSRNPMYLAGPSIILGWAILFRSGGVLFYGLIVAVAMHLRVVFYEEPRLARHSWKDWERYRARVPRWIFPNRRVMFASFAAAAVVLPLAGLIYEAYSDARAAQRYPPPGQLVDIGGRRLHLICIGEGRPVVMFVASSFGSSLSSVDARERISRRVQTCSFDRMGMGWSDEGPDSASPADLALELAVLQDRARLPQPFILVASSIGGLTAEAFAAQYSERVAGLVFLDAASSSLAEAIGSWAGAAHAAACAAAVAARFGVIRLIDPFGFDAEGTDAAARGSAITYGARPWGTICAMARGIVGDRKANHPAPKLPADVPLLVLSAENERQTFPGFEWLATRRRDVRLAAHQALAKRSSRGSWRIVPKSSHLIASSQPDAVVEAIFTMLDEVK